MPTVETGGEGWLGWPHRQGWRYDRQVG